MNQDYEVVHVPAPSTALAEPAAPAPPPPSAPPAPAPVLFEHLHRVLRGRYRWAISLMLLGGLAGASAGWFLPQRLYRSTGAIRVVPVLPNIVYRDANGQMPMFDSFVELQVVLLKGPQVIREAVETDTWKAVQDRLPGLDPDYLTENLDVRHDSRSEVISVAFVSRDPVVATAGVRSVLDAYAKLFAEKDRQTKQRTLEVLRKREDQLDKQVKDLRRQILQIASEFGSDTLLERMYESKLQEASKLESQWREAQIAVAVAESAAKAAPGTAGPATRPVTPEEIAVIDPQMRDLLKERGTQERKIEGLRVTYSENHVQVIEARKVLESLNAQVARYAEEFRKPSMWPLTQPHAGSELVITPAALDRLREREQKIHEVYEKARLEMVDLGRKNMQIQNLRTDLAGNAQLLADTRTRIDQLEVESREAERISFISRGEEATLAKDRRKFMSVLGGMGGGGLGFSVVLAMALASRRLRHADDARLSIGHMPILGLLPQLPDSLSDPAKVAITAHCVHQIRALLQLGAERNAPPAFAITSPAAGNGKTSLTLALGVSFAASRSRTLLIDFDMVGGGLTSRTSALLHRKLGQILCARHGVTPAQVEAGLKWSRNSGRRIGEALVELGYLKTDDLAAALRTQGKKPQGLLDVLNGEPLAACVSDTEVPCLAVLPLGAARAQHVDRLSPAVIQSILAQARQQFDTILIDTGPVPGSMEASLVATEADGVVVVVSRGGHRGVTGQAVEHLVSIGARIAGIVFNRAGSGDVRHYTTSVRLTSEPAWTPAEPAAPSAESAESDKLGPLARAVVAYGSAAHNGNKAGKS